MLSLKGILNKSINIISTTSINNNKTFTKETEWGKMKIVVSKELDKKQEVLFLGLFEEDKHNYKSLSSKLAEELHKDKTFKGKFAEMHCSMVEVAPFRKVVVMGMGKQKEFDLEKLRKLLGKAVKKTKAKKCTSLTTNIVDLVKNKFDKELLGRSAAEGLLLGNYCFSKYLAKERQEKNKPLEMAALVYSGNDNTFSKGLKTGRVIAENTNFVRDLVNEPANVANSIYLEKVARKVAASSSKISIKVLGREELEKEKMYSMLGVNKGSANPPKLIILRYNGGGNGKYTAILGKGITFDSGGYNLKPTKYIEDMKTDMGGSAVALAMVKTAADLGLKKNVMGVMGVCENMVDSKAQRPGDIVRAYNGKTIEIGNTDAEGRLVLADALAYTEKNYKPEVMIDLATLTGACVVALGYYAAALISRDEKLLNQLKSSGESSGDRVWPMPFFDEYQDWMDGSISDLNNISQRGKGYEAGSITAGVFLSKFVNTDKVRWAHLDIAGSAYWTVDGAYLGKGATGSGVRVLSYWLMDN